MLDDQALIFRWVLTTSLKDEAPQFATTSCAAQHFLYRRAPR